VTVFIVATHRYYCVAKTYL